ncbi:SDR family NAD(P)-dependent oxidoreductase [Corallococcus sp. M34]|uniref:type I polyketide synthase n=1 Tax=Citreicoccus inhibens TaxID=2849499 RepID=UPI001C21A90B|nr:type I polyketide synthase [Citreicoccus inhibens]MBU8900206.1 SDR family NAD(P)-dependent oxidoreductase [Citreicoccus inhibens]
MKEIPLAVVGLACRYPDASSPAELWETVVAQRRAFRPMPAARLRMEDYFSADPHAADRTPAREVAVLEGYVFDRLRFRVAGSSFRSADMTHWLALEVAADALRDAGLDEGRELPRETTGVIVGNTLTGEFSRAQGLRLRWPYVRRWVEDALGREQWEPERLALFLAGLEDRFKSPFSPVGEETLAGGLSNTIAGRICNHFDLRGGGFTVDGACASSLLAVTQACGALVAGDLDVVLAGGVDLSLDPFELVGFAKAGALATEDMRVYDERAAGFWPGEGCGFAVLMRHDDAVARGLRVRALVRGWGVSSDGHGGLTRPEVEGQRLALRRAYHRAGFGIDTVGYFEGHGTGTAVGDATELKALSAALREAGAPRSVVAALGSVKANIGHTKAAAGLAGLIKAIQALEARALPPMPGAGRPHALLRGESPVLRVLHDVEEWPDFGPLRAAVSAMGFGGINTHVVLEAPPSTRRAPLGLRERRLAASAQDAELFLLGEASLDALVARVSALRGLVTHLSRAELVDLAFELQRRAGGSRFRAALVAATPGELATRLDRLARELAEGVTSRCDVEAGVFLGEGARAPRIGFLFPGQGSPAHLGGGSWRRRFASVRDLLEPHVPEEGPDGTVDTAVVQPAIVAASLAGLRVLGEAGVVAEVAVGHSLGELTALGWAGAMDEASLRALARTRGQAMAALGVPSGAMAGIAADRARVEPLLAGLPVSVASCNSPRQTVVSGEARAVDIAMTRAREQGLAASRLAVSHAFHSPLMAPVAESLRASLANLAFPPPRRAVASTVNGRLLGANEDLRALLVEQLTAPVRFTSALEAAGAVDLWLEVGPGQVLTGLGADNVSTPVVALDVGGSSLRGLLRAVGAAFAMGAPCVPSALFDGRFARPFDPSRKRLFLENPCESAPVPDSASPREARPASPLPTAPRSEEHSPEPQPQASALDVVRRLVAARAELPEQAIGDDDRLLGDLHLNSISVSRIATEAARVLGLPPLLAPLEFARAQVRTLAQALEDLRREGSHARGPAASLPDGVDAWVRAFTVAWTARPLPPVGPQAWPVGTWTVFSSAAEAHATELSARLNALCPGPGIAVRVSAATTETDARMLLRAAHAALESRGPRRFLVIQHEGGCAAFARSLHLEAPDVAVGVVDVPEDHPQALEWVLAEARALSPGVRECRYTREGVREEPDLRPLFLAKTVIPGLGENDILLVTGGGKGITYECALALARSSGARLGLIGRARPDEDAVLATNLHRLQAAGIRASYVAVDISAPTGAHRAVRELEAALEGPITAVLHGAGLNEPRPLSRLDESSLRATLAPKVEGLRNVLAAVSSDSVRLLIGFGSVIGRLGMEGQADYALANAWLTREVERWGAQRPACRCLCVEWSVWSGLGMGERLGRVEALAQRGIQAIPPEQGVAMLRALLATPTSPVAVMVTARMGAQPMLPAASGALPFLRFVEQVRVHQPGVELVVDIELSDGTDLSLDEHVFRGERLWPAVLGLEAMAQVATALMGQERAPDFEQVRFERPVVVPSGTRRTLRIAALATATDSVEVVVRSEETSFQVDHFRATCRWPAQSLTSTCSERWPVPRDEERVHQGLDPERDLYGRLFFHTGRFQRIARYLRLRATECVAELTATPDAPWFARYLPARLVLGEPSTRDAALHAIQACIPHGQLLPVGVNAIRRAATGEEPRHVIARELSSDGQHFTYDVELCDARGDVVERWEGLRLKRIESTPEPTAWPASLLAPYMERRIGELLPGATLHVALDARPDEVRPGRTDRVLRSVMGATGAVFRRPDGKPVPTSGVGASASHAGPLTMAVTGPGSVGCDMEPVEARTAPVWRELLGPERSALAERVAREHGEDLASAATRVWTAIECLKKAGLPAATRLAVTGAEPDGWILFGAGARRVATLRTHLREHSGPLVLAALSGGNDARV